jgi:tyrosinase
MGCRKNLARLTPAEQHAFVNAVLALKASGQYDRFNEIHARTMDPSGVMVHGMPLFFPWHRRLILDYEHELQTIDPSVSLPYWGYLAREKHTSDTAH